MERHQLFEARKISQNDIHIIRRMKATLLLLIFGTCIVSANDILSQEAKVSFQLSDTSIKQLIGEIERQSDYVFVWMDNIDSETNKKVDINVKDEKVDYVLDKIFSETQLSYEILGKQVVVYLDRTKSNTKKPSVVPLSILQQTKKIVTGRVIDNRGDEIIGANILEKGLANGTVTDIEGKFSLEVAPNATLVVSYIGYNTQEVKVGNQNDYTITLSENTLGLEEVVVVGYGTQKKIDVTGAISSVGEKTIREIPAANISQSIQGRIAGVQVQQTSTRPGQTPQLRIRGTRSLTASNDPLLIIDGMPFEGSINDVDPENIKSLEILKDASSTAIYGARGANGVIIITTYRGIETKKPNITYNGYFGFGMPAKKYTLYNPEEFLELRRESQYNSGNLFADEQEMYDAGQSTDWQDLMYQTSHRNSHDVSVISGGEYTQVSFGGGYYNESSIVPGPLFQRFSFRGTIDQKINNRFKIGINTLNTYGVTNGESADIMYSILTLTPFTNPYNKDGTINVAPRFMYNSDEMRNPLLIKDENLWKEQRRRFNSFNTFYAEVNIWDGLRYRLNAGFNFYHDNYGSYYNSNTPMKNGGLSEANINNKTGYGYMVDNLLYYDKVFNNKHRFGFTGLFGLQENTSFNTWATAKDMVTDYVYYYNLGLSNTPVEIDSRRQSYSSRRMVSYMLRANYAYNDKYLLSLTGRFDGSSVLAPGYQWHFYKAASAGWNVGMEDFMADIDWLDNLKIRGGYGETSNEAIAPYSTIAILTPNYYNFDNTYVNGYYTMNVGNKELGWEYTDAYSLGVDFGLFNGRISGSVDLYLQHTYDLLLNQVLPYSTGILSPFLTNVGKTENKGVEITLHTVNLQNAKGFTWDMDLNFSLNRSKIKALNAGVDKIENSGWFVGYPVDVIYDYKQIGIWQLGEEEEAAVYGARPGRQHIEDVNNDGVLSELDKQVIGSFEPDFEFGWTNHLYFKNFDLTLVSYGKVGGMLVSSIHQGQSYVNQMNGRRNGIKVNYWTETNPSNDFPGVRGNGDYPPYPSSLGYFDASYFRIRTITLGYDFPKNWFKSLGVEGLRAYFTVDNACILFSSYVNKYGGLDPEPTGYGSQARVSGYSFAMAQDRQLTIGPTVPPSRSFIFGLNVKF
ncbi:MAG: TonB-dependent receptor [Tannerellaceae bacterium]|jgi:TonB-linked SusC/RagA family outer membrane protein|nr:TonB-dependent receptor [Tannerellaceae bacterium]